MIPFSTSFCLNFREKRLVVRNHRYLQYVYNQRHYTARQNYNIQQTIARLYLAAWYAQRPQAIAIFEYITTYESDMCVWRKNNSAAWTNKSKPIFIRFRAYGLRAYVRGDWINGLGQNLENRNLMQEKTLQINLF